VQAHGVVVGQWAAQLGRVVALQERGVDVGGQPRRRAQHAHQQVAVGGDAVQPGAGQGAGQPGRRLLAGGAVRDHLRQHRVVVHSHLGTALDAAVDPHALDRRDLEPVQRPGRGQEAALRVLRVQPRLDGVPRHRACATSGGSGSPIATRSCSRTRSSP
jgi:hypothetical protein